jgi:hypothetical protein
MFSSLKCPEGLSGPQSLLFNGSFHVPVRGDIWGGGIVPWY